MDINTDTKFLTPYDVEGCRDWEFGGAASYGGLVRYATLHGDEYEYDSSDHDSRARSRDALIAAYLRSVGENPTDYSVA